jgi:hypothetical protein
MRTFKSKIRGVFPYLPYVILGLQGLTAWLTPSQTNYKMTAHYFKPIV